jgi:hypothetical protein
VVRYVQIVTQNDAQSVSLTRGRKLKVNTMWASQETLERIAELAMKDDHLLSMLVEWNETQDFGEQDMIFCKIMNYYKDAAPKEIKNVEV